MAVRGKSSPVNGCFARPERKVPTPSRPTWRHAASRVAQGVVDDLLGCVATCGAQEQQEKSHLCGAHLLFKASRCVVWSFKGLKPKLMSALRSIEPTPQGASGLSMLAALSDRWASKIEAVLK